MEFIFALTPILVFFVLLLLRRSVIFSSFFALISIVLVGFVAWGMEIQRIFSASGKGFLLATEISFMVFGALLIFEILKENKLVIFLKSLFEWVSKDDRVHVVLIAWGVVYFFEGVAGFGTPAMVAIPIFLALGYKPLTSVSLALIGNSVSVIFGAIGLPVTYGIGSVLETIGVKTEIMASIPFLVAILNVFGSVFIPLVLIFVFCLFENKPISHFFEFVPFALVSGLITAIGSFLTILYIGPELSSVIGGVVAIFAISFMARKKVFLPKIEEDEKLSYAPNIKNHKNQILKAVSPYIIMVFLLVLSRVPFLPIKNFLIDSFQISIYKLFSQNIDFSFYPLYSAGFIIFVSACVSILIVGLNMIQIKNIFYSAFSKIYKPYLSLIIIIAFVQIFIYSGDNIFGLESMPVILAKKLSSLFGSIWPVVSPFVGAFGSFAAGSATVSNLMFSGFQYETAVISGFNPSLILALQGVGAAAGNMISLHNVIVALAVAQIYKKEVFIISRNILPLVLYLFIVGIFGLFLSIIIF